MRSILALSSEGIVVDKKSNNASVFNILEKLSSPAFPLFFPKIYFFCMLKREADEPSEYELNLHVINNENVILQQTLSANFRDQLRHRHIMEIGGMPIPAPGQLKFSLRLNEDELASYSIEVVQIGPPHVENVE